MANADRPLISAEVARVTGIHRATCHRLLSVLCQLGYLHRDDQAKTYMTGFYLHTYGRPENLIRFVVSRAHDVLVDCAATIGEAVMLGYLQGVQIVVCDQIMIGSQEEGRIPPNSRFSSHSTAIGKALLALKPVDEVRRLYSDFPVFSRTKETIKSTDALLADLRRTTTRGYAISDEEDQITVFEAAVPVFNPERRATFAIGFRLFKNASSEAEIAQKIKILGRVSSILTKHLTGLELRNRELETGYE